MVLLVSVSVPIKQWSIQWERPHYTLAASLPYCTVRVDMRDLLAATCRPGYYGGDQTHAP
jgi:hypothetical protein